MRDSDNKTPISKPATELGSQGPAFAEHTFRRAMLASDPHKQFSDWYEEAQASLTGSSYANPCTIATVDQNNQPFARTVLLKSFDTEGFYFYTNYQSRKGKHLEKNNQASLCFFWEKLERQVIIIGYVEKVSAEQSDQYFSSRPQGSQFSASLSKQSSVIANRQVLTDQLSYLEKKHASTAISRPKHWGGYKLIAKEIEFWQGQPNRLHDRFIYRKSGSGQWQIDRLAP